jgi:hypothetical protein
VSSIAFASTHGGCAHYRAELPSRVLGLFAPRMTVVWGDDLSYNALLGSPIGIYHELGDQRDHENVPFFEPDVISLAGAYPVALGADIIRVARAHGQRVICDCDDWPELPPENPHYRPEGAELKLEALRAASAVTCSTPALRAHLLEHGINATMIRNTIDAERYRFEHDENVARRHASALVEHASGVDPEPLVVAYRGLLAGFHDDDVRELAGRLPDEGIRYVHVGADPRSANTFAELAGVPAELVREVPAASFELYGPGLAGVDVALIPMAPRPFSAAKSAIAALEWHAAGVPWLGSNQSELVRAGNGNGIMALGADWPQGLGYLTSAKRRERLYRDQIPPSDTIGGRWAELVLAVLDRPA